ncbi:hypothetical protein FO440_11350 [Mucilaginibacter corticis]|uniref:Uncharacterized protein n=1 Tax=Mucilaginibacter corticis TaxID=2597670 RepID=A0A556MKB1_9SPHI|nr:hypothetical protein [Mucilaginibacter corticis]TSJ40348.1 hypothetical protein FO440_11350 [Mucilaginibacter corticis]
MLNKYLTLSLLFLTLCILACKKDKSTDYANVVFPHKLYVTGVTQKGTIRVYTANGEITDMALKNKFIGKDSTYFNLAYQPSDTSSMTFIDRDTAMFSSSTLKYAVTKNITQFLFTSKFRSPLNKSDFIYNLLKYHDPAPASINGAVIEGEVRVGYGDYNNLSFSRLSYKIVSSSSFQNVFQYKSSAGALFNEFNSSVITQLKTNDTLAIQEAAVVLKSR